MQHTNKCNIQTKRVYTHMSVPMNSKCLHKWQDMVIVRRATASAQWIVGPEATRGAVVSLQFLRRVSPLTRVVDVLKNKGAICKPHT